MVKMAPLTLRRRDMGFCHFFFLFFRAFHSGDSGLMFTEHCEGKLYFSPLLRFHPSDFLKEGLGVFVKFSEMRKNN